MIEQDFIGVFDGVASIDLCKALIDHFETLTKAGLAIPREQAAHEKDDTSIYLMETWKVLHFEPVVKPFLDIFWPCWRQYAKKYSVLNQIARYGIQRMKIQKTLPGGGYHLWHFENAHPMSADPFAAFTLYLNDVQEGGETEYLYQKRRIEAKQGRLVIWPAGFTHPHRGNPPLSGEKYILTGWLEWMA